MKFLGIVQQFCKLAFIVKLNVVNLMEMVDVLVSLFGYIGMEAYYREENVFPSECLPERGGVHLWQEEFRFLLKSVIISVCQELYILSYMCDLQFVW